MADEKVVKFVSEVGSVSDRAEKVEAFKDKFVEGIKKLTENAKKAADAQVKAAKDGIFSQKSYDTFVSNLLKSKFKSPGRGPGRPSDDPIDDDGPSPPGGKPEKAWYVKLVQKMQRVVTAFEGTNGRATKGLAVLRRTLEAVDKAQQASSANTVRAAGQATNAQTVATTATNAVTHANKVSATAALTFGGTLTGVGVSTAIFGVAVAAAALAANLLSRAIENLEDVVGKFSGALIQAQVQTKVAELQEHLRSAGRVGGELSVLEDANRKIIITLIRIKTELVDLLGPFIEIVASALNFILKSIETFLSLFNGIKDLIEGFFTTILSILEYIPIIGDAATKAKQWMTEDNIRQAGKYEKLNAVVDDFFFGVDIGSDQLNRERGIQINPGIIKFVPDSR